MRQDLDLLAQVDAVTIHILASRVPKVSSSDLRALARPMERGVLFRNIQDSQQRNAIWERLQNIDYPIPTLQTFFKDIHYLEVGRSVMRNLFLPDPGEKVTIDVGVGRQYRISVPLIISERQERIRQELYDLWRFSLQYGFEMNDHRRRVPRKKAEIQVGLRLPSRSNLVGRPALWQHFFWLASQHQFDVPMVHGTEFQSVNLPLEVPCDYPENSEKDVALNRRCGKPFTDSVEADRFALSRQSLGQPWAARRVTAGFVRRSVFQAFFSYLHPGSSGELSFTASDDISEPQGVTFI